MINKTEIEKITGSCGVCAFDDIKDRLLPCRKINLIPQNAKSVVLFTFPYKVKEEKPLNISRYAAVNDYHPVVENILKGYCENLKKAFPDNEFVPFVDNSPVPEVTAAVKAGLGVKGKNGLLITKEYGSFVFIGEIVTDLLIESANGSKACIGCDACLKTCPVALNKENCLSKITQQKSALTHEQIQLIKNSGCVWGCDICSNVCPMNNNAKTTFIKEFIDSYRHSYVKGEDTANRPYIWRGKEIIERNHNILCSDEPQ